MNLATSPAAAAGIALVTAALLLGRARRDALSMLPLVVLVPLAAAVGAAPRFDLGWPVLAVGLVVAALARERTDLLQSECAIKLLWVMGISIALSGAGGMLLTLSTGTPIIPEQWAILNLGVDSGRLWSAALPLSLLLGLVLLGAAPFHFWAADLFQGAPAWLGPLAVAALQVLGAGALMHRLEGLEQFPDGARMARRLLEWAALTALAAGAATLLAQRRPERRVGTLASLQGALILATLASTRGAPSAAGLAAWAAHLVLALAGGATVARFLPVSSTAAAGPAVLFRRHPVSGALGLYAILSLAGVPGTPGASLWLGAVRSAVAAQRPWLLVALGLAWVAAFATAARQLRESFGVTERSEPPEAKVPWQARAALCLSGGALLGEVVWVWVSRFVRCAAPPTSSRPSPPPVEFSPRRNTARRGRRDPGTRFA